MQHAAQGADRDPRQHHHGAVRMNEELHAIAGPEPKVVSDGLRQGRLALDRQGGFHGGAPITFVEK